MKFTLAAISVYLLPLASAAGACTNSGALAWPPVGDCPKADKYGTITANCRACCLVDYKCFNTCTKNGGLRRRDATGEQVFAVRKREVTSRAIALSCVGVERCYKYTDGDLLCLNLATGNLPSSEAVRKANVVFLGAYYDDAGGKGDFYTGEYTYADGRVVTGTAGPSGTAVSKSSSSSTSRTISVASLTTTRAVGITSGAATLATSTMASTTSRATGDAARLGANVGFIGVIAGLLL